MNETDPHDESLRIILDLDMDRAELERLEAALGQLGTDAILSQRLDELLHIKQTLTGPDHPVDDPLGGAEAFQNRLIGSIGRAPARPAWTGRFVTGFAGGIAAAAVLFIGFISVGWWDNPEGGGLGIVAEVPNHTAWLPEDPSQQRALLTQLAGFYDGRAGWYAVTGQDVRMGLADHRIDTSEPVVTRLSLADPDGNVLSTDLALFPGQDVTVDAPRSDGTHVSYAIRVHPASDAGRGMMLSLTVSMGDGSTMSTEIPLAGTAVREVGRLLTDQGQYELRLGFAGAS